MMHKKVIALALLAGLLTTQAHAAESSAVVAAGGRVDVASAQAAQTQDWALRLPNDTNLQFCGVLSNESVVGSGSAMLYPAPNVAGLVAALVTHGLLNSAARKREATLAQETANKVLDPYRGLIGDLRHDDVFQLALAQRRANGKSRVAVPGEAPSADWMFVVEPVFSMTQDQNALLLDIAVVVYAPNAPATPAYQNALRVVSAPIASDDPLVFWSENKGQNLKAVSAQLMAMALELAANEVDKNNPKDGESSAANQRTMRYVQGKSERIERAELLRVTCDRAVIKTLRGGLMWVPLKQPHAYSVSQNATPLECDVTEKK
jgi:hypothetical protein